MSISKKIPILALVTLVALSCNFIVGLPSTPTLLPTKPPTAPPSPAPLATTPVRPSASNPNEPVLITGDIPYTSPFFINTISQAFVLLEDEAGFVRRDRDFQFSPTGQVIGPVKADSSNRLTYSLQLPAVPQGTYVDVDNDAEQDQGVQVFAVAYWSNIWGDPFLEARDGTGWSTAYASTITNPEKEDEIVGGILVVWAPDDQQGFPTGFGQDGLLFTEDDPIGRIAAGYNLVDLNQEPFLIYKEANPHITLNEGAVAVNDFSKLGYLESFKALFDKASKEYPFTQDKGIDWSALYDEFLPQVQKVRTPDDYYRVLRDFTLRIPDGHVNLSFNRTVFNENCGGGFGIVLEELSDGRVIVTSLISDTPADIAGLKVGAEIIRWDNMDIAEAIAKETPCFGPFSTEHAKRIAQVYALGRTSTGKRLNVTFKNPGASAQSKTLEAVPEFDSLLKTLPSYSQDELALPLEGYRLDDSGLGYIRLTTFSADYNLMARLWEHYIQALVDEDIPGLIIDLRMNYGGSLGIALDFAGYFTEKEMDLYRALYYNSQTGVFEATERPARVKPAPLFYPGSIAVLVSTNCVSACEGFVYALKQMGRTTVVGHYPTAGAFGEVGRGQYKLPNEITLQFPTGRPETLDDKLLIEGTGILPDITVPVTLESALGQVDALLQAAVQALLKQIKR